MPKWWNEQQVCGTYTREAHTVGAQTGEKGTHVGRARKRGARAERGARTEKGARTAKGRAHREGGARGKVGGTEKGARTANGRARKGGRARRRGRARAKGARGRAGPRGGGGAHGQVARTCTSLMVAAAPATWVAWAHTRAPVNGARTGGAHGFKEGRIYVLPSSFEFAKPSPPGSLPST
jgi:hypothetical protein